jgi:hypothetical protein
MGYRVYGKEKYTPKSVTMNEHSLWKTKQLSYVNFYPISQSNIPQKSLLQKYITWN